MAASHTLDREEFESWLNAAAEEALDHGDQTPRGLGRWVKALCLELHRRAAEEAHEDENTDEAFGGDEAFELGED